MTFLSVLLTKLACARALSNAEAIKSQTLRLPQCGSPLEPLDAVEAAGHRGCRISVVSPHFAPDMTRYYITLDRETALYCKI